MEKYGSENLPALSIFYDVLGVFLYRSYDLNLELDVMNLMLDEGWTKMMVYFQSMHVVDMKCYKKFGKMWGYVAMCRVLSYSSSFVD